MLLRSFSKSILNSWLPHSKDYSPDPECQIHQRTKSISFHSQPSIDDPTKKISTPSQSLQQEAYTQKPKKGSPISPSHCNKQKCKKDRNEEEKEPKANSRIQTLLSTSGLEERVVNDDDKEKACGLQALVGSCGGDGVRGGGGGGTRSDSVDGNGGSEFCGKDSTDAYYQKMISVDPGNALLLVNYAKFLKEIRGDLSKAEEYCARAILANPNDGNILSIYADLIWQREKDAQRAESYFDQAVRTSPDDCYILASYARFLWDAEDEDEDGQQETRSSTGVFDGSLDNSHVSAAS